MDREGLLFIYRTQWGIKFINKIGKKYPKTLNVLSYISIIMGYLLMIGVLYFTYTILKIYLFNPLIVQAIKVPPILPLVPYLPQIFHLNFLPPFYFTYWIAIIAIVAICHEFAHGIFMKRYNIRIKSTGFAFFPYFFPIFPAAFVEQDEKSMNKSKKFEQMAVLSAGTFANVLVAILFFGVMFLFFSLAFTPSGIIFDTYANSEIIVAGISAINGVSLINPSYDQVIETASEDGFIEIEAGGGTYLATKEILQQQEENDGSIIIYHSAPAINKNLTSIITMINDEEISSLEDLTEKLSKYSPGEQITITTKTEEGFNKIVIGLEEHPENPGASWLGIGFYDRSRSGFFGKIIDTLSFKKSNVYYTSRIGEFGMFIYNLLWWLILISISVALVNMLPVGIFDGGKFFYLTIFGLTKSEKIAKRASKISTKLFLLILVLLVVFWGIGMFW